MATVIVLGVDNAHSDPDTQTRLCYRRGDFVDMDPADGALVETAPGSGVFHGGGGSGVAPPKFFYCTFSDMSVAELSTYLQDNVNVVIPDEATGLTLLEYGTVTELHIANLRFDTRKAYYVNLDAHTFDGNGYAVMTKADIKRRLT